MTQLEQNYIKVIKFMNEKKCKMDTTEMSDFLQENDICYIYFENIEDYFNYMNEDEEKNDFVNITAREYMIFATSGELFILTD